MSFNFSVGWVVQIGPDELVGPFESEFQAEDWLDEHLTPYQGVRRKFKLIRITDPRDWPSINPVDPQTKIV